MNRLSALLLVILFLKSSASAQHTDTIPSSISLDEIIISANKVEEKKRNISQQIESISRIEIERLHSQSTADLIANAAGVSVQKSQQGGGSPVIRGFEASRVLLVIDGVRMNNLIYRTGHLQNVVTTDNTILERLEVLYGPSSTIYGSDALGGVVHIYTRKPQFASGVKKNIVVNGLTRYGSVNREKTVHADINIGGKRFASLSSFTHSDFGDLKGGSNQNPFYTSSYGERHYYVERINGKDSLLRNDDRYLQKQSGFRQYDFLQKFAFLQSENIQHHLNLQFSTSSDVPRYDRLTDAGPAGLRYAEWYYGPQQRLLAAYDLRIQNTESFLQKFHAGINFQQIEESRHTRLFNDDHKESRTENVNVLGFSIDGTRVSANHAFNSGIDGQFNTLKSTAELVNIAEGGSEKLDTRYPDGDNNMANAAMYVSHSWHVSEDLIINDGVRLGYSTLNSEFNDTSFFRLPFTSAEQDHFVYSGSLGLVHLPSQDVKLSLLLSTGFRVPNIDDLSKVFESGTGALIVPNQELQPEKTISYETGFTKTWNNVTEWENAVYYTQLIDAIITDNFTYNGQDSILYNGVQSAVFANQNKQKAYIYGFSSSLRSQVSDHLSFSLQANYTYGRIKTDSLDYPLDHIPPFGVRFKTVLSYNRFNSDLFINYNGWKRLKDYNMNGEDNEQYATPAGMPAWFTINMHFSYKLMKQFTLQAGIDNVFDTQYRVFASGINAPGRNIFAALRFSY